MADKVKILEAISMIAQEHTENELTFTVNTVVDKPIFQKNATVRTVIHIEISEPV